MLRCSVTPLHESQYNVSAVRNAISSGEQEIMMNQIYLIV